MSAITHLFAGVPVSDLDTSIDWYTRFFGRLPDSRVGDEVLWEIDERAWLFIEPNAARAGAGRITLAVAGLELFRRLAQPAFILGGGLKNVDIGAIAVRIGLVARDARFRHVHQHVPEALFLEQAPPRRLLQQDACLALRLRERLLHVYVCPRLEGLQRRIEMRSGGRAHVDEVRLFVTEQLTGRRIDSGARRAGQGPGRGLVGVLHADHAMRHTDPRQRPGVQGRHATRSDERDSEHSGGVGCKRNASVICCAPATASGSTMARFCRDSGHAMRVLITDGNERASLAAARSLVAAGHDVYVAAPERFSLAGAARGVRSLQIQVDPLAQPQRFARTVGGAASRLNIDVALPISDASVEAILLHRVELPERVRMLPTDLRLRSRELRERARRRSEPRGAIGVAGALVRLGRLVLGSRDVLSPYAVVAAALRPAILVAALFAFGGITQHCRRWGLRVFF